VTIKASTTHAAPLARVAADIDPALAPFRPIRLRKAADEVVAVLIDAIRGGLFQIGDRLPRERDLAARLEVSRTTVREAIGVLERAGVVSVRRGNSGGSRVKSVANVPAVLATLHGDTQLSLRSLLEVRRPLELQAALLASARATPDDLSRLEGLVDMLGPLKNPDEFLAVDIQFHLQVAAVAQNPQLLEFLRAYFDRWQVIRDSYPIGHVDFETAMANQRNTLEAIASRNRRRVMKSVDRHLTPTELIFIGEKLEFP
jgi:GntR family transcriptional repressor for pyruvate dehydrogenase complex